MPTHFTFGRQRLSEAQQPGQGKLFDLDASNDATTAGQANTAILSGDLSASLSVCPRCHEEREPHSKHVAICRECYEALRQEATRQQEVAYLCAWLRSRVDKDGFPLEDSALVAHPADRKRAIRLAAVAKKLSVPWTEPTAQTEQIALSTRMRSLLAPYGGSGSDGGEAA